METAADQSCTNRSYDGKRRTGLDVEAPTDAAIAEIARRQHGVVGRGQLDELDISYGQIEARLRRGSLHQIHRGVYAVGHRCLDIYGRWMAAVLACGPDAVLSHRSAARCWGLLRGDSGANEVTRPRSHRGQTGIVMHQARLPADESTVVDGIPVTTVPRTIFDLAVAGDRRLVERALHETEVQHLTDRLSIPDLLGRYPGHAGAPVLRELVALGAEGGSTANDFEALFAAMVERHRLPWPRFNADMVVAGRHFRPDCVWWEQRVVVELDSRTVHSTRKAFDADRERDRIFVANGWRVVRVTWRQLTTNPAPLVRDLRRVWASLLPFPTHRRERQDWWWPRLPCGGERGAVRGVSAG